MAAVDGMRNVTRAATDGASVRGASVRMAESKSAAMIADRIRAKIDAGCAALLAASLVLLAGCADDRSTQPRLAASVAERGAACNTTPNSGCPPCPACPPSAQKPQPAASATLTPASFTDLPNWRDDDHAAALVAFQRGCRALERRAAWRSACTQAANVAVDRHSAQAFFESQFQVFRVASSDGATSGLVTGYYEPILRGSRKRSGAFAHPVYAAPDDLISVELAGSQPEVAGLRLRGRLEGRRLVPYHTRGDIDQGKAPLQGKELVFIDDPIELFFLHVQGSGRVRLESGEMVRVGYADQNGHPYRSIGRSLIDRGELLPEQASMQGIQAWARANPGRVAELLSQNPSYIFFREVPTSEAPPDTGPQGSLGVPLTAGRSMAVDARSVPLGAPVYLATTYPNTSRALERLMVAQDTGSAIRGAVRGDFYWGSGPEAGREAGRMRQQGRMWVLLPRDYTPGNDTRTP